MIWYNAALVKVKEATEIFQRVAPCCSLSTKWKIRSTSVFEPCLKGSWFVKQKVTSYRDKPLTNRLSADQTDAPDMILVDTRWQPCLPRNMTLFFQLTDPQTAATPHPVLTPNGRSSQIFRRFLLHLPDEIRRFVGVVSCSRTFRCLVDAETSRNRWIFLIASAASGH